MAEAKRDANRVTTLLAVSNADGITPVVVYADPTTHRILVSASAASPAGSDTEVQFNDGGTMAGDAGFTYNKTTDTATLAGDLKADRVGMEDTNSSHYLYLEPGSNITADRVLTLTTGDADRTVSLSGNLTVSSAATVSGTNTGDQTISLTSDVTGSGTGSFATTIANDAVTNAKMADMAQSTIKGRAAGAGTGDPTDLTATQATAILDNVVGDSGSGGTKGLVPAPAAGDTASGKFLKADGTWTTPPASGDVTKVGTPANNQIAVWTGDGTLEGTSDFTYDGTNLNLITAKNFQIAGATVLADAAGTTTLSNIDALDTTTEATIEDAIDTLANLVSIQGRTVTLADAGADAILGWDDSANAYENLTQAEVLAVVGDSSETAKGVVELSTDAEAVTGTDTARAVTPANLTARLAAPGAIGSTTKATSIQVDESGLLVDPTGDADADLVTVGVTDSPKIRWDESDDRFVATKDIEVPDEAYGVGWNGSLEAPTKNAVYDKIETIGAGIGYVLRQCNSADGTNNLADSTTYYLGPMNLGNFSVTDSRGATRLYIPKAGTIKAAYGAITVSGTLSSGEDSTVAIRLNNTSNTNISTTVETSAASNAFSATGLSIAVVAGDFIDILLITPAFATEPGGVYMSCSVYIE